MAQYCAGVTLFSQSDLLFVSQQQKPEKLKRSIKYSNSKML